MMKHKKISPDIFKGKRVLDIGCGRNKLAGAIGVDCMALPGVDVVADLSKRLPFDDGSFDAVHANQVLEHVDDIVALVYEVHRILRPGGIFVAHMPYFRSVWAHTDPTHRRSFTIRTMDYFVKNTWIHDNNRFRDDGFASVEVFLDNEYPSTFLRRFFAGRALGNPWRFENSFLSSLYPFEQISYLLIK